MYRSTRGYYSHYMWYVVQFAKAVLHLRRDGWLWPCHGMIQKIRHVDNIRWVPWQEQHCPNAMAFVFAEITGWIYAGATTTKRGRVKNLICWSMAFRITLILHTDVYTSSSVSYSASSEVSSPYSWSSVLSSSSPSISSFGSSMSLGMWEKR